MISVLSLAPVLAYGAAVTSNVSQTRPILQQSANGEFLSRNYPPGALKRGEQGKVHFVLGIDKKGALTSCEITESSGFTGLDSDTCQLFIKHGKFKPAINAEGRRVDTVMRGFINWQLPSNASSASAADRVGAVLDPQKVVCRSYARTGSKVGRIKQCMTREEWALKDDLNREEARRFQDVGGGCPSTGC